MSSATLRNSLGRVLREHRLAAQLTQRQLGERAGGIAAGEIWRFESGKRAPNLDTLVRIAQGLRVPLRTLLDIETDEVVPATPAELDEEGAEAPPPEGLIELYGALERLRGQPPEVVQTAVAAVDALLKVG